MSLAMRKRNITGTGSDSQSSVQPRHEHVYVGVMALGKRPARSLAGRLWSSGDFPTRRLSAFGLWRRCGLLDATVCAQTRRACLLALTSARKMIACALLSGDDAERGHDVRSVREGRNR